MKFHVINLVSFPSRNPQLLRSLHNPSHDLQFTERKFCKDERQKLPPTTQKTVSNEEPIPENSQFEPDKGALHVHGGCRVYWGA